MGTIEWGFFHRVPVSIEKPTVYPLQSVVACDWACWLCLSQESSLLVVLDMFSSFNTKMGGAAGPSGWKPSVSEEGSAWGHLVVGAPETEGWPPPLFLTYGSISSQARRDFIEVYAWCYMKQNEPSPYSGHQPHLSIPAVSIMGGPAEKFITRFNGYDNVRFFPQSACQYTAVHSLPPREGLSV